MRPRGRERGKWRCERYSSILAVARGLSISPRNAATPLAGVLVRAWFHELHSDVSRRFPWLILFFWVSFTNLFPTN